MPRLEVERSLPSQGSDALYRLVGFLLDQVGGSIVLSPREQEHIFHDGPPRMIQAYKDDRGNFQMKVEPRNDQ